jgi:hypothetical protein
MVPFQRRGCHGNCSPAAASLRSSTAGSFYIFPASTGGIGSPGSTTAHSAGCKRVATSGEAETGRHVVLWCILAGVLVVRGTNSNACGCSFIVPALYSISAY